MRLLLRLTLAGLWMPSTAAWAESQMLTVDCIYGPYYTIQSALDDIGEDYHAVVVVHPCTYYENVELAQLGYITLVTADGPPYRGSVGAVGLGVGTGLHQVAEIDGDSLGGSCIWLYRTNFITIEGFVLSNCRHGVELYDAYDTAIVGNRMRGMTSWTIAETEVTNQLQIVGNVLSNSEGGIKIAEGFESMIADNRIGFMTGRGIELTSDFSVVVNNHFHQIGEQAVWVASSTAYNPLIARNHFELVGSGVWPAVELLPQVSYASVVGNIGLTYIDAGVDNLFAENL